MQVNTHSRNRTSALLTALVLLTAVAAPAVAAPDKKAAITDAKDAGPDFAVQGEYAGEIQGKKFGAQVVALGDEKFDVTLFTGGLPGDGWKRGDQQQKDTGALKDGVTTFAKLQASIQSGALEIAGGKLAKVERKSPTLGAKPPEGATVLFGEKANEFTGGETTPQGELMAMGKGGQSSKFKFTKSFSFHLEFRTPYQPYARGQGRGNSGVFLPGIPEIQVLDSFGLSGANNECGGFYSKREPDVNMCFPPLSWQTYDVEMTMGKDKEKGRVIVKHNGVVVHDQPSDYKGGGNLNLQNHGNPVVYRNIWVVEK